MKNSKKSVFIILAVILIISAVMTCIAAVYTLQADAQIFPQLYILSAITGLLLIGAGYLVSKKHPTAQKVLTAIGIYDLVVTAVIFLIVGV